MRQKYPRRSKHKMSRHGRTGRPVIHKGETGREYIMVRRKAGGTKRLYLDSKKFKKEVTVHNK